MKLVSVVTLGSLGKESKLDAVVNESIQNYVCVGNVQRYAHLSTSAVTLGRNPTNCDPEQFSGVV